jgi:hypothetical protein
VPYALPKKGCPAIGDLAPEEAIAVSAKRIAVWDIRVDGVLADIQRAVEGELDEDERLRRIAELAESLQSEPPSVEQAISAAVARAAEAGTITKDEAQRLAKRF